MRIFLALASLSFALLAGSSVAVAAKCTPYEAAVFELADDAKGFQESRKFQEYGYSAKGPFNAWFKRFESLRDDKDQMREFWLTYDFSPVDVYSVADEYRTAGRLDDFWKETERTIRKAKRCRS